MSTEKPTVPETVFNYAINLVVLDAIRNLIGKLVPCDKINSSQVEDVLANVNQMYRDHNEAFEVTSEDEIAEEVMSEDEESDVNQPKKNHESIHD